MGYRNQIVHFFLLVFSTLGHVDGRSLRTNGDTRAEVYRQSRAERFPSIEERVKIYMSNWYVPPCEQYLEGHVGYGYETSGDYKEIINWPRLLLRGFQNETSLVANPTASMNLDSIIEPDMVFFLDRDIVLDCANASVPTDDNKETPREEGGYDRQRDIASRIKVRINMRMYCHDVADTLLTALDHVAWEVSRTQKSQIRQQQQRIPAPPTLLQFGDNGASHVYGNVNVPHIKKFRSAVSEAAEISRVTEPTKSSSSSSQCYSGPRSFLNTVHGNIKLQPIVWKLATHRHFDKLYSIFREDTTWSEKKDMAIFRGQLTGSKWGFNKTLSDYENCQKLMRCRMVFDHANSTLIDAKLTNTRNRLPSVLDGVDLMSKKVSLGKMLEYKGIIMIEGNDVASGLKWALLSQSVVLMPVPKHTSWAMEELLQPWVVSVFIDLLSFYRFSCRILDEFREIHT